MENVSNIPCEITPPPAKPPRTVGVGAFQNIDLKVDPEKKSPIASKGKIIYLFSNN
jgi:hypothetical protein